MNIKEYLKYYIGQKCHYASHHEPQGETYVLTTDKLAEAIEFGDMPELRRIESLTEDEKLQIADLSEQFRPENHVLPATSISKRWAAVQTHYLLSLGIDLFGLIDAGLAVDAATIKSNG